uniref:Uncharacterized protein n=1 Tax=viral metagenome TaxID=1070528 RepID=A0A6C0HPZ4_9ZZZZ
MYSVSVNCLFHIFVSLSLFKTIIINIIINMIINNIINI